MHNLVQNLYTSNCYMNPVSRVSLHITFRTHELVELLFLKRYGFDISF